jgi:PqqD family protein of HPr-rel-A system
VIDLLATPHWQVAATEVIDWREWGDEFVVRVASRSETHLLNAAAGSILLVLLDAHAALTLDEICATATQDADPSAASDMTAAERQSLQTILADFERLGIVTRTAA